MKPGPVRDVFFRMRAQRFTLKQISAALGVSRATLYRWNKIGPVSGLRQTRPRARYVRRKLDDSMANALLAHIKANNTITHRQAAQWLFDTFSVRVSLATVANYCRRLNLTRKKATKAYTEMDEQKAEQWLRDIAVGFGPHVLALDEAAFVYHHVRGYAWSEKGTRAIVKRPATHYKAHRLLLCISVTGVVEWQIYEGSITAADFIDFLQALPSGSTLVLDNCQIHKATDVLTRQNLPTVAEAAADKHIELNYLPPYTPQLNPVELCFDTIRTYINREQPRDKASLLHTIQQAVHSLTHNVCRDTVHKVFRL